MRASDECPCGSGSPYRSCCEPFLDGAPAPTAEQLMRSRYTAFVRGNEDHLFRTWHPATRPSDVRPDPGITWLGLEVVRHEFQPTFEQELQDISLRGIFRSGRLSGRVVIAI